MKIILILFVLISSVSSAQKKDTTLTDSTKFLSIKDIDRLSQKYQDVTTYKEYQSFLKIMNAIIQDAILEYRKKK